MSQSPYLESGDGKASGRKRRSQEEAGASKSKGADWSMLRINQQVVSAGALVTMDFGFCFRDHMLSHPVYKPGGVTETSHHCLSSYHNLQSILASQVRALRLLLCRTLWT
jgi:hypothetical protein